MYCHCYRVSHRYLLQNYYKSPQGIWHLSWFSESVLFSVCCWLWTDCAQARAAQAGGGGQVAWPGCKHSNCVAEPRVQSTESNCHDLTTAINRIQQNRSNQYMYMTSNNMVSFILYSKGRKLLYSHLYLMIGCYTDTEVELWDVGSVLGRVVRGRPLPVWGRGAGPTHLQARVTAVPGET